MVDAAASTTSSLRRWPEEVDVPMRAALPPHDGEDGEFPAGVALPIAKARLRIAAADRTKRSRHRPRSHLHRSPSREGWTKMQTWFYGRTARRLAEPILSMWNESNSHLRTSRRRLMGMAAGLPGALFAQNASRDAELRKLLEPPAGKSQVVIDTDTYNEIDDQFAVAYGILSPDRMEVEACTRPLPQRPLHRRRRRHAEELRRRSCAF